MKLLNNTSLTYILASGAVGSALTILAQRCLRKFLQPEVDCMFFSPCDIHAMNTPLPCPKMACPLCSFAKLCDLLRDTNTQVDICMYLITEQELANVIVTLHKRGVKIRVITDKQMCEDSQRCKSGFLIKYRIPVKYVMSRGMMHNKFIIIDRKCVVTGSCNWTQNALMSNFENMIVVHNDEAAKKYLGYFNELWACENFI